MQVCLVTGSLGFLGAHFVAELFDAWPDCQIISYDAEFYSSDRARIPTDIWTSDRFEHVTANVGNQSRVLDVLTRRGVTHVFHFAAQTHVTRSFEVPTEYVQDNILATHALLEACRLHAKLTCLFVMSTDEVYGDGQNLKGEDAPFHPTSPYSASKAAADLLCQAYARCYRMPIVGIRGNNIYGPMQHPEKLIPRFISLMSKGEDLTVEGSGLQTRNFVHVHDMCRAILIVVERGVFGQMYNVSGDTVVSVLDLAKMLLAAQPTCPSQVVHVTDRLYNDDAYNIDDGLLRGLGWAPQKDFDKEIIALLINAIAEGTNAL